MEEPWKHFIKWKNPDKTAKYPWSYLYEMSWTDRSIDTEKQIHGCQEDEGERKGDLSANEF